jgi:beta-lactamase class A
MTSPTDELLATAKDAGLTIWLHATRLSGPDARVDLNGSDPVALASLYKLPLALVWADLVAAGQLDPCAPLAMPARDRIHGPTGVAMLLDDVTLTARDAVRLMLAVSDNTSADALIGHIGQDRLNAHLLDLGMPDTVIRRGSGAVQKELMLETGTTTPAEAERQLADPDHEPRTRQYDPAYSSASTASDVCSVLAQLWGRDSPAHQCVRDAMALQAWRHRIGSGFPHDDVTVHGKTGTLGRLRHEAAVIGFPHEHPVAVTVLTRAVRNERHLPRADAAIGELARTAVTALRMHIA